MTRGTLKFLLGALVLPAAAIAQAPAAAPKFEVASVKPCKDDGGPGFRGGRGIQSPGRLDLVCQTLRVFILRAFLFYRGGRYDFFRPLPEIRGAPDWIDDRYSIAAMAASPARPETMNGPMLQALLEERFKLKVHLETKEMPVYELTVAKGGLKAPRFAPGSCTPIDWSRPLETLDLSPGPNPCANSNRLDRPVIDKTGLAGLFNFRMQYVPEDGPYLFDVLQRQLGLRLMPARGPGEILVVDHVERPSAN